MGILQKVARLKLVSDNTGEKVTLTATDFYRKYCQAYTRSYDDLCKRNTELGGTKMSEATVTQILDNIAELLMIDIASTVFGEKAAEDALNAVLNDRELLLAD